MKKKSSHLKNLKHFLKHEQKTINIVQGFNRQRIELPKIGASTFQTLIAKKTLTATIKKIEEYIQAAENHVPIITNQCLSVLKAELRKYPSYISSGVRKTQSSQPSQFKENQWVTQSQIFNVNMSRLRKVASKDLFDKVTTVKYSVGQLINVNQQEVISALKEKLKQKDTTIKRLHNHIEELQLDINNLKQDIETSCSLNTTLLSQKERLMQELDQVKMINQRKGEEKWELSEDNSKMKEENSELNQRCKVMFSQLREKEAQIVSMWILLMNLSPQ